MAKHQRPKEPADAGAPGDDGLGWAGESEAAHRHGLARLADPAMESTTLKSVAMAVKGFGDLLIMVGSPLLRLSDFPQKKIGIKPDEYDYNFAGNGGTHFRKSGDGPPPDCTHTIMLRWQVSIPLPQGCGSLTGSAVQQAINRQVEQATDIARGMCVSTGCPEPSVEIIYQEWDCWVAREAGQKDTLWIGIYFRIGCQPEAE